MYTDEMSKAFKAIKAPGEFKVTLYDNDDFITMVIDPEDIENLLDNQVSDAVQYINDVKKVLEELGAIIYIVRDSLKD